MQYQTTYADKNAWQTVGKRMNLFFVASYRILICFHSRSIQRSKFSWNHFQIIMPGKIGLFMDMLKHFRLKISYGTIKKLTSELSNGFIWPGNSSPNDKWWMIWSVRWFLFFRPRISWTSWPPKNNVIDIWVLSYELFTYRYLWSFRAQYE